MLRAAGACVTGPAHLQAFQPGQDALALRGWRGGWIVAVADGLGSRARSATGSRLAVRAAQQIARQWSPASWQELPARQCATDLYRRWLACDAEGRARVWQLGDGMVLCRLGGRVQVITPDRPGFGNQTRALGTHRAWSDWHTASFTLREPGDLVLLMTDGVSDDLAAPSLDGFTQVVHRQIQQRSRRQGRRWLTHELTHWATPLHSDDKTVAVVFRE
jgi:serine/threonine protein phosphatase PrpC